MEKLSSRRRIMFPVSALMATVLTGCTLDSYLTDPSIVHCDGKRTQTPLKGNGIATFIVKGEHAGSIAAVKVRRTNDGASVNVSGDVTGPPQQLESDGFTPPFPVVEGPELSAFGAGAAWVIDVRNDSVVIQGTCSSM